MTLRSMTGFGSAQWPTALGLLSVDIRSVNNRFFELSLRIPEDFRSLEPIIRDRLAKALPRGKVDVRMSLLRQPAQDLKPIEPQPEKLRSLLALQKQLAQEFPNTVAPWQMGDLLAFPGVLQQPEPLADPHDHPAVLEAFEAAILSLEASRRSEGEKLSTMVLSRLEALSALRMQAIDHMPLALKAQREKIKLRLEEAFALAPPVESASDAHRAFLAERIQQEAHAAAARADIAEELDRLGAHIQATQDVFSNSNDQPQGKKLDFLCQELHREANTLGAKSSNIELTQISIHMKLTIEQIREQVQNIQ